MPAARHFFSEEEKKAVRDCIVAAEAGTTGEIRVHIERKCAIEPLERAAVCFEKLNMRQTKNRNGVLIYLAIESKVFACYGDEAIYTKTTQAFWDEISQEMFRDFSNGFFSLGVQKAIRAAGEKLKEFFPSTGANKNELADEISFE
jgi:uncharacterized membrane protein